MSASGSFSIRNPFGYVGALIGLNAIAILAVPVLQYLVVRHVKAEGDRVRGGFKWLHGALFTLWVTCVLQLAYHAYLLSSATSSTPTLFREVSNRLNCISSVSALSAILADVLLVFCVARLVSSAATTAATTAATAAPRRVYGYLVSAALGVAVVFGFVLFGYNIWSTITSRGFSSRFGFAQSFSIVYLVEAIMVLLAAVGVFVQAMQAKKAAGAGATVVRRLAVIAGLVMVLMMFGFTRTTVSLSGVIPGTHGLDITGLQFADIIVGSWGSFGVMVMIYLVGKKREGGLWSENRGKLDRHSEDGVSA